jgi:hypothetical protein
MTPTPPSLPSRTATLPKTRPDLRQAMTLFAREVLAALASAQSGTVQAFYKGPPQTVDVAFNSSIVVGYETSASGQVTPVTRNYPLLPGVPCIFLGGGGGALTFPVGPGDTALLVFLDRDHDVWLTTGQTGLPPNSSRLHSLSDAVAIVGLRNAVNALKNFSTAGVELNHPSVTVNGNFHVSTGSTGMFLSADGQIVTVADGVIIAIQ